MFINVETNDYGVAIASFIMSYDELTKTGRMFDDLLLPDDVIENYMNEAADDVLGHINYFGLAWNNEARVVTLRTYWAPHDRLKYARDAIASCRVVTSLVHASYENASPDFANWGPLLSNLGGDDDVDYNGSYLDIVIDVIEAHLNHYVHDCLVQG